MPELVTDLVITLRFIIDDHPLDTDWADLHRHCQLIETDPVNNARCYRPGLCTWHLLYEDADRLVQYRTGPDTRTWSEWVEPLVCVYHLYTTEATP